MKYPWGGSLGDGKLDPPDSPEIIEADDEACETCKRVLHVEYWLDNNGRGKRQYVHRDHCEFHLRVACGWCKKAMGYQACEEERDGQITHAMCDKCVRDWLDQIEG